MLKRPSWCRAKTSEPPAPPGQRDDEGTTLSDFERHTLWATHARWVMDHVQHRLEMTGQLALGALGIQGVLLTLVASAFTETADIWTVRLNAAALVGLAASAGLILFGAFPRKVSGINPDSYRAGWKREHSDDRWHSPDQQFAEELLQTDDESTSPLAAAEDLNERRMRWIRSGLIVSGCSLVLVAAGTLWPVIEDLV